MDIKEDTRSVIFFMIYIMTTSYIPLFMVSYLRGPDQCIQYRTLFFSKRDSNNQLEVTEKFKQIILMLELQEN